MNIGYIIVQAGGKGTRLEHLTRNKPKCLVPYNNLPILFHLFRQFPDKKFIVIGDYKYRVLENYLESFANVKYLTVRAEGQGTCGGIERALAIVPDAAPFILMWSDIILHPSAGFDNLEDADYIGISGGFECRWSFIQNRCLARPSKENGIAGFFIFRDKNSLANVPKEGEFVRFLSGGEIGFRRYELTGAREIGTLTDIQSVQNGNQFRCRPFNRLETQGDTITKTPIDDFGKKLAARELAWYREVTKYGYKKIPEIVSWEPFTMKRIDGCNIYQAKLDDCQKKELIDTIVASLEELHRFKGAGFDAFSAKEAYYTKTIDRIAKVRSLIPFADKKEIRINGRTCRNVYFLYDELRELTARLLYKGSFAFIHGDCTFSNMMTNTGLQVIFLDPRGYFGFTELYGDTAYDFAKVFYSINGNYDQFNNHNFSLDIRDDEVFIDIASNGWEHLSDYFFSKIPGIPAVHIKLIHALIWLSLTTYAWEDYDSICGAFYKGLLVFDDFCRQAGFLEGV